MNCEKCPLQSSVKKPLVGVGPIPADVLFIFPAPSRAEFNIQRTCPPPLFEELIRRAGMVGISYHITFAIRCCGKAVDWEPNIADSLYCREELNELLLQVNPRHIVIVGTPLKRALKMSLDHSIIAHPMTLTKDGGVSSPDFLRNVRILEGIANNIRKEGQYE